MQTHPLWIREFLVWSGNALLGRPPKELYMYDWQFDYEWNLIVSYIDIYIHVGLALRTFVLRHQVVWVHVNQSSL